MIRAVVAIVLGLAGLFMTVCGLGFTINVVPQTWEILYLTVPSMALGLLVLWVARKVWQSRNRTSP